MVEVVEVLVSVVLETVVVEVTVVVVGKAVQRRVGSTTEKRRASQLSLKPAAAVVVVWPSSHTGVHVAPLPRPMHGP